MKKFAVKYASTDYIVIYVDAEDEDSAIELADEIIGDSSAFPESDVEFGEWEVMEVEETDSD